MWYKIIHLYPKFNGFNQWILGMDNKFHRTGSSIIHVDEMGTMWRTLSCQVKHAMRYISIKSTAHRRERSMVAFFNSISDWCAIFFCLCIILAGICRKSIVSGFMWHQTIPQCCKLTLMCVRFGSGPLSSRFTVVGIHIANLRRSHDRPRFIIGLRT